MNITVTYHREDDGMWADSPDVEGLSVAGATLAEVRELVREGLPFYLDTSEPIELHEQFADATTPVIDFVMAPVAIGVYTTGGFAVGPVQQPRLAPPPAIRRAAGTQTSSTTGGVPIPA